MDEKCPILPYKWCNWEAAVSPVFFGSVTAGLIAPEGGEKVPRRGPFSYVNK